MLTLHKADSESASVCAASMLEGNVAILPTDTVYGLSAIASDPFTQNDTGAISIRLIKGRSESKPFIVLIEKSQDIQQYTDEVIPPALLSLWPGALTIVVRAKNISASIPRPNAPYSSPLRIAACPPPCFTPPFRQGFSPTSSTCLPFSSFHSAPKGCSSAATADSRPIDSTIALRCPGDEWLRLVISLCGHPIYSTSCNISGSPALNLVKDILHTFQTPSASSASGSDALRPALFIDDGDKTARPSTIVSIIDGNLKILRQGDVTVECRH